MVFDKELKEQKSFYLGDVARGPCAEVVTAFGEFDGVAKVTGP